MMNTPAIILGDPKCILRLPKAGLRNRSDWTQDDSDTLAHLIQVQSQIQNSRWNRSDLRFRTQGDKLLEHSFPEFEDFVFAAVYVRQLVAQNDSLLDDAAKRYCRFVDCPVRSSWVQHEVDSFKKCLDEPVPMGAGCSAIQLFDAFMYGAGLLHKFQRTGRTNRERFLELFDKQPRHTLLFALHTSLKELMNYVGAVTVVIHRDYSHWLHDNSLPAPDTRWHNKLFEINATA